MKVVRETLETLTQCVLLPGVDLKFDEVVTYLNGGIGGVLIKGVKRFRF
jgi:hypothetical protein